VSEKEALEAERDLLKNLKPAFEAVVEVFADAVERNFATESAADERFAPLADSTIEQRRRLGFGASPILQRTGKMRGGATAFRDITEEYADVGPDPELPASYHMSTAPRSKIPFRDFYAVSEEDVEKMEAAVVRALEEAGGK